MVAAVVEGSNYGYLCQDPAQYNGSHVPQGIDVFDEVDWDNKLADRDCNFYLTRETIHIDPRFAGQLYGLSLQTVECDMFTKPTIEFYANAVGCCRDQKSKCEISPATSKVSVTTASSTPSSITPSPTTNAVDSSESQAEENTSIIAGVSASVVVIILLIIAGVVVTRKNRKSKASAVAKQPPTMNPSFQDGNVLHVQTIKGMKRFGDDVGAGDVVKDEAKDEAKDANPPNFRISGVNQDEAKDARSSFSSF